MASLENAKIPVFSREHDHYLKVSIPNRGKWFYPIVHVGSNRKAIEKQFKRARDAESWALRFDRKLAAGAFAKQLLPVMEGEFRAEFQYTEAKWYQRLWAWIVKMLRSLTHASL